MREGDMIGGRYCLKEILGQGGSGVVYLALDNRLNQAVAVKVLHEENPAQLEKELRLQKGLRHPMLPGILDVVEMEKRCCIVMEYVEGVTLDAYLKKNGAVDERQAVETALQILDVLEYLHTRRPPVICQDLKPANIMICPDGTVKLVDFGALSYRYYDGRRLTAQGTKGYASPEQLAGNGRRIGVQSDLYSFGAILYSMLTGIRLQYPPYRMDGIRELFPHVSKRTAMVIERCTAESPEGRYQDARDVKRALSSDGAAGDKKEGGSLLQKVRGIYLSKRKREKLRYTARVKSIFLSAKKHAGLWGILAALMVGQLTAENLNGVFRNVCGGWGVFHREILPVTVYNEQGQKVLIKYGSVYDLYGDFLVEVPKESLLPDTATTLRITVSGPFGTSCRERVFRLNPVQ